MNKIIILSMILICFYGVGCQNSESLPTTGNYQPGMGWFDRAMIKLMEKWELPGGALTVISDGEIILARGYGFADIENHRLVEPDSLFRVASISKPFTAVAVLKLVEEGELSLNTPAFQILDKFQTADGSQVDPRRDQITIRNLLEHSAGWDLNASFDPMFMSIEIAQQMGTEPPADCPTIIQYMLDKPLDYDPGTHYAYSNFGYCVLGRVIEHVSGMGYEDYVKESILLPIGIEDMRIGRSRLSIQATDEVHYYSKDSTLVPSIFPEEADLTTWPYGGFYLEGMDSHGGWIASATDLTRFAVALDRGDVLNPDSLKTMIERPKIPFWAQKPHYYAKGWYVRPNNQDAVLWHTGSLPGTTAVLYQAANGLTWAALFNTRPEPPNDELIVDIITEMGKAAFLDKMIGISLIILVVLISAGVIFYFLCRRVKTHPERLPKI
jgi:N-acyl-D-amino-acid deacylase